MIESSGAHGSATPSPFASVPQRSQVAGMNCIQPTAPAELGPMLRPKFDSILLIAARTCHGIPYAAPARCHRASSWANVSVRGASVETVQPGGNSSDPSAFGTSALASAGGASGTIANTGGDAPEAPAAPTSAATRARMAAARDIGLRRLGVDDAKPGQRLAHRHLGGAKRPAGRRLGRLR